MSGRLEEPITQRPTGSLPQEWLGVEGVLPQPWKGHSPLLWLEQNGSSQVPALNLKSIFRPSWCIGKGVFYNGFLGTSRLQKRDPRLARGRAMHTTCNDSTGGR